MKKRTNVGKIIKNNLIAPIIFWSLVLLVVLTRTGGLITFDEHTGHVGDTIGGVLGPFLNFAGLLFVWYSLRDQLAINKKQARALKLERKQQRKSNEHQKSERALAICLRLVEEMHKYWIANKDSISRLLSEESKMLFTNPVALEESIEYFWSETEFWAVSRDFIRARVFLNVLRETALDLSKEQRILVTTLFEENYYTHLRRLRLINRESNQDDWAVFSNRYPNTKLPPARTVVELNSQLDAFDTFCESIGARGQWLRL